VDFFIFERWEHKKRLAYVAGICRNQAFPEIPRQFQKCLDFPQLPIHLQKMLFIENAQILGNGIVSVKKLLQN